MTASIARPRWGWEVAFVHVAAVLLVAASAGLGALAAWTTGSAKGPALGALLVIAALGLEICKPLALVAAIQAGWRQPVQAAGLMMLAAGAVAFSLISELTLMAGARSDTAAGRAGQSERISDMRAARDRLALQLAALPAGKPSAAIEAEIGARMASRSDLDGCEAKWLPSSKARAVCIEVGRLRGELASARHRERVASDLAAVDGALQGLGPPLTADPAAAALAAYGKAAGLPIDPAAVAPWLALVPVLALEIGSALAGLLVRSAAGGAAGRRPRGDLPDTAGRQAGGGLIVAADCPAAAAAHRRVASADAPAALAAPTVTGRGDIAADRQTLAGDPEDRITEAIKAAGGRWTGSQRQLATALGLGRSCVGEALNRLAEKRAVRLTTDPRGTTVELAATG